jgi:hypothetical protein
MPAQDIEMVSYHPPMPIKVAIEALKLKRILSKQESFNNQKTQALILDYLNDGSCIPIATLSHEATFSPPEERVWKRLKCFFMPIVRMRFLHKDKQLIVSMAKKPTDVSTNILIWSITSHKLIADGVHEKYIRDIELECCRPPAIVQATSDNQALKAVVTHEFYPNDDEYPAPGNGAYKPKYEATVDIVWNCSYKQLLAYVFSKMGR